MSKYPLIERETIDEFIELVQGGISQASAATAVGRDITSIRLWIQRNDLEMPHVREPVTGDVISYADDYRSGRMTQKEIAIACGCSSPYVSKFLAQYSDGHIKSKQVKGCKQIIDHIKKNGGRPKATARLLGISFSSTVFYTYVREQGIDLRPYQFAGLEYGSWLVVAGDWRKAGSNYYVSSLCRRCGTVFQDVNLNNMRGGRSTCCQGCSIGNTEGPSRVECISTGVIHKSIMSLCSALDRSNHYQSIRLQLNKNGTVAINGDEYQLINS